MQGHDICGFFFFFFFFHVAPKVVIKKVYPNLATKQIEKEKI
jgi:hypothetical protein